MAPCFANVNSALHLMLITTLISITDFAIADYCQGYTDVTGEPVTGFYCPGFHDDYQNYKCCGPSDGQYCCNYEDYNNYHGRFYWSVGKIVGVAIAGVIGLVLLVVVIVIFVACYVRRVKQQQRQRPATVSVGQEMTRSTTRQSRSHPQQNRSHSQQSRSNAQSKQQGMTREQAYESLSYPPPAYTTLSQQGDFHEPQPPYPSSHEGYRQQSQPQPLLQPQPQSQLQMLASMSYTDYSQQGLEEYSSPQPDFYSHKPEAANTYAPEMAPPPPPPIDF